MPTTYRLIGLLLLLFISKFIWAQTILFTPEEEKWIKAHPVVEFGSSIDWEPYIFYEDGVYTGIINDYLKEIEKATGIDMVPIENMSWEKAMKSLKNGTLHVAPAAFITEDRKEFLLFTEPYITEPIVIVTRDSYEFIGTLDELNGRKIALPKKYYTQEIISKQYPEINIIPLKSVKECLEYLRDEKVDAFVGSLGVVSYYMNHKGFFDDLKIAAPTNFENSQFALAVTKDWEIFRDICQKILETISIKRRSEIRKEWISVRYEHGFSWKVFFYWTRIIASAVISLFLVIYFWNKSLSKQIKRREKNEILLKNSLTKIQKQDQEKKVLLQEIHHRVKNNLQIITSLMRLQSNTSENENTISSLNQSIDRIRAVALIHEKTYNSENLNNISTEEYIKSLATDIITNLSNTSKIDLTVNTTDVLIGPDKIVPLALILNELIVNSIHHGLKNELGKITILLKNENDIIEMIYDDSGLWIENSESKQFGTSIIEIFTEQLDGTYNLIKKENGTRYQFIFNNSSLI